MHGILQPFTLTKSDDEIRAFLKEVLEKDEKERLGRKKNY